MAKTYDEFLYQYFKQLHLNDMSEGQAARLKDLQGQEVTVPTVNGDVSVYPDDKRSGAQKGWNKGPLPDISELSETEIDKLYRNILNALRELKKDEARIKQDVNPKLPEVWAPFFGDINDPKPFYAHKIDLTRMPDLEPLIDLLRDQSHPVTLQVEELLYEKDYKLGDFIKDFDDRNFGGKFIDVVNRIIRNVSSTASLYSSRPEYDDFRAPNGRFLQLRKQLDPDEEIIDQLKIDLFKQPQNYMRIFGLLYSDSKFKEQFAGTSSGREVTNQLDRVKKNIDYSKLVPKMTDKLSILDSAKKKIGDFIDGRVGKLFDRHKRHNYMTPAKGIMEAIVKTGLKPTDGLEKILAKDGDIQALLASNSPVSAGGWTLFVSVLKEIKDGMPKAFAGCLKNGSQMNAVVQQVIARCMEMEPPKFDEAKMILETLSVLRYGNLTSDKWAAWKENLMIKELKGFDKGFLKWFATGAKFVVNNTVNAIFWAGQILANKLGRVGTRFNGNKLGALEKPLQKYNYDDEDYNADETDPDSAYTYLQKVREAHNAVTPKDNAIVENEINMADANKAISEQKTSMDAMNKWRRMHEVDMEIADDLKTKMDNAQQDVETAKQDLKEANADYKARPRGKRASFWSKVLEARKKLKDAQDRLAEIQSKYKLAEDRANISKKDYDEAFADYKAAEDRFNKADEIAQDPFANLIKERNEFQATHPKGTPNPFDGKVNAFQKKREFDIARMNMNNKRKRERARKDNAVANGQAYSVADVQKEKRKYDMMVELMAFWNYQTLELGAVNDWNPGRGHKNNQNEPVIYQFTQYAQAWQARKAA